MTVKAITAGIPRRLPRAAIVVLITAVYGCAIYANLSFAIRDSADYRFFPPFQPHVDANHSNQLASENFNIAKSLVAGTGFAHPFNEPTGPTAWMTPVLPTFLAGLLWVFGGDRDAAMAVVIFLQVNVLIGTGILSLVLALRTTHKIGTGLVIAAYLAGLLSLFYMCFQLTQDCWLVLLAVDLLTAGLCCWQPLRSKQTAVLWGLFGGLCALINPIVALTWGILSFGTCLRSRSWLQFSLAALVAGLTVTPWVVRNYLVLGSLIPMKSNLAYELYQSQCMQPDGLLKHDTLPFHPYTIGTPEGQCYKNLGEVAYLQRKGEQFWQAVSAAPGEFLKRLAERFLGATLWYVPFERSDEVKRPWANGLNRVLHPLPFLGLLVLLGTSFWQPLSRAQWIVICLYLCYLLPYIVISYYDRYAMPLVGLKVLLVIWAVDRLWSLLSMPSRE
jgi:hypothetical protein